jgi:signal-transduction protein with cAMP-binding, CBS, and nucleotidyltransferase domain
MQSKASPEAIMHWLGTKAQWLSQQHYWVHTAKRESLKGVELLVDPQGFTNTMLVYIRNRMLKLCTRQNIVINLEDKISVVLKNGVHVIKPGSFSGMKQ